MRSLTVIVGDYGSTREYASWARIDAATDAFNEGASDGIPTSISQALTTSSGSPGTLQRRYKPRACPWAGPGRVPCLGNGRDETETGGACLGQEVDRL